MKIFTNIFMVFTLFILNDPLIGSDIVQIGPRSIGSYLEQTEGQTRIMVVGSTRGYRDYPANYYLIDRKKQKGVEPDYKIDIMRAEQFSPEFNGKFDIVEFEFVPVTIYTIVTFQNAARFLKPGGKIILPSIISVSKIADWQVDFLEELVPGYFVDRKKIGKSTIDIYTNKDPKNNHVYEEGRKLGVRLLAEYIDEYFIDLQLVPDNERPEHWLAKLPRRGLLIATKK